MRRRAVESLISGCIRGAVVLAALAGAAGSAPGREARGGARAAAPHRPAERLPAAALAVQAAQARQPNSHDLVEENRQEYRALLISELQFCRNACDLTTSKVSRSLGEPAPSSNEAAAEAAEARAEARAARGNPARHRSGAAECRQAGSRGILIKLVKEHATPVQQSRYQAELEQTGALIGGRLRFTRWSPGSTECSILSSDQRSGSCKCSTSNWDDEWGAIGEHPGRR